VLEQEYALKRYFPLNFIGVECEKFQKSGSFKAITLHLPCNFVVTAAYDV